MPSNLFDITAPDGEWADLARATREALRLLGYGITPKCLPDEADPCGCTFRQHVAAHLGGLLAVVQHHAAHLGPQWDDLIVGAYENAADEFDDPGFCQRHGGHRG